MPEEPKPKVLLRRVGFLEDMEVSEEPEPSERGSFGHGCPVPSTHDKLQESHWFIHEMVRHYHDPSGFRYSLGGFIQAARNTTFMMQSELANAKWFRPWYAEKQGWMRGNADLAVLHKLRTRIVH